MNKFAFVIVLIAAIGAGFVFYQFQQDDDSARLEDVRIAAEEKVQDEARRNAAKIRKDDSVRAAAETEGDPDSDRVVSEKEGLRVVGRLVNESRNPIPGVKVSLAEIQNKPSIALLAPGSRIAKKNEDSCVSADDGSFYFVGVKPNARYELRAWPREYRAVRHDFDFFSKEQYDAGDLIAKEGAVLAGRVLNAASIPVPGATVSISVPDDRLGGLLILGGSASPGTRTVVADENGVFRAAGLKSGKAHVVTKAKGFPPREGIKVDISVKNPVEDFVIQLENGREIFGSVVDAQGKPAKGVTIEFRPADGFSPLYFGQDRPRVTVDDQGKFVLKGVPRRAVKLSAHGPGFMTLKGQRVAADENTTLIEIDRAAVIYGYLKAQEGGQSIGKFDISLTDRPGANLLGFGNNTGKPEIRKGASAAKALGMKVSENFFAVVNISKTRASFQIRAEGFQSLRFREENLKGGEKREVTARVAPEVIFGGTVVDRQGNPVAKAKLVMVRQSNDNPGALTDSPSGSFVTGTSMISSVNRDRHQEESGSDGTFAFHGLIAGEYKLSVRHDKFLDVSDRVVTLAADQPHQDNRIELARGATLKGVVYDENNEPLPGARVSLRQKRDDDINQAESDTEEIIGDFVSRGALKAVAEGGGVYLFQGVKPGNYLVSAKKPKDNRQSGAVLVIMGSATKQSGGVDVVLEPDKITEKDLHIKKKARVFGRVHAGGQPIVAAKVAESSANDRGWGFGAKSASSDDEGFFEIAELEPGEHTFTLTLNGSPYSSRRKITLAEGQQTKLDFNLPTGTLRGRVLDGEGNPVAGAKVTAKRSTKEDSLEERESDRITGAVSVVLSAEDGSDGEFMAFSGAVGVDPSVTSDDDGYYAIPYLSGGIYDLKCRKSGYAPAKLSAVELAKDSTLANLDLVLHAACKLTVRATHRSDSSTFFRVEVKKAKGKSESKSRYFQPGGSASFTSLTPGTYKVTCRAGDEKKEETVTVGLGDDQTLTFDF